MQVRDSVFARDAVYDLLVATCGYERRSSYLCRLGVAADKKFAIIHGDVVGAAFEENVCDYDDGIWIKSRLKDTLEALDSAIATDPSLRVGIDISSMPRGAIASIVATLVRRPPTQPVEFFYVPGAFQSSLLAAQRSEVLSAGPVDPFFSGELRAPSSPIGLILGIGLEPYRSLGIVELLEPTRTWAFVGRGTDDRFSEELARAQKALGGVVDESSIFQYDLHSVASIYSALESLSFSVGVEFRLIMAPSGPKVFTLACLLVGTSRDSNRPAIWRVGGVSPGPAMNVVEAGEVIATEVKFDRAAGPA